MMEAVTTRNKVLLEMVLKQPGVDVNERDSDNTAPLITAAKLCYTEIMDVLLKHRANVNILDKRGEWMSACVCLLGVSGGGGGGGGWCGWGLLGGPRGGVFGRVVLGAIFFLDGKIKIIC